MASGACGEHDDVVILPPSDALRVGCVPDLPLQRLQAFLGALYARMPALHAEVAHLRTDEQLRRLRREELDVGLVHDPGDEHGVETQVVFSGERLTAIVSAEHPLARADTVSAATLAHTVLLVPPRAADAALSEWLLSQLQRDEHRFAEVRELGDSDPRDVLFAVAEGRGVTLAPRSLLRAAGEVGALLTALTLDPPLWMPDTAIAWRAGDPALLAAIRELARALRD